MSLACFARVQDESKNGGVAYLLLLMLADMAHDDGMGQCPTMAHLARVIRTPEYCLPQLIWILESTGELNWNDPEGCFQITVGGRPVPTPAPLIGTEDKRRSGRHGYVYILRSAHGCKIGKAKVLAERISALTIQLPFPVELIHSIESDDASAAEARLHSSFAEQRINGEWFDLSEEQIAWLRTIEFITMEE